VFTHALLLKAGRVFASGHKSEIMTTQQLRKVFGAAVTLQAVDGRYALGVKSNTRVVV